MNRTGGGNCSSDRGGLLVCRLIARFGGSAQFRGPHAYQRATKSHEIFTVFSTSTILIFVSTAR